MKSGLDFKKFKDITLLIISTYNLKLLIDGKKTNDSQYELNRSQNTVEKLTSISDLLSAEIKKKKILIATLGLNDSYNQQVSDLYGSLKDLSLKVQIAKIKELHMQEKFKNLKFLVESGKFETLGNIIKEKENDNKEFDEINSQLTKVITNLQSFDKTHQLDLMKAINNPEILQKLRESKELEDFKKRLVESNLLELELELEDNINKSSILDVDWFKGLNVLQQIGLSFLIFKGIILSCLTSIIFIFFGDYLLNKYDIEVRFPKLAKIIKLRRKFSNYYLIYNVGIIALIAIIESIFIISYMDVDIFSIIS